MLYIVPTPIGNLEDITLRAITILKRADWILAEDTRRSGILLKHFNIESKMLSYHQHNEHELTVQVIEKLKNGAQVALISDSGTPGVSDAGFLLVRECIRNEIPVSCLPGATAFLPALIVSGFPTDEFLFVGFLPQKKGRQTRLRELSVEKRTIVFYESPNRLVRLLQELKKYFGVERKISVSRELTKIHEETNRGMAEQLLSIYNSKTIKGEIVVVVGPPDNG